jgi:SEC-C motif
MSINHNHFSFRITENPDFQDDIFGITPNLKTQFESLHKEVQDKNNNVIIEKLIQLTIQYPYTPQLKNFLSVAYAKREMLDKAFEVNDWILKEHPEYLFARLNKVSQYIDNQNFDEAEKILGRSFDLQKIYPHRKLFHLAEVTGYLKMVVKFFANQDDFDTADEYLDILINIAPTHPDTIYCEEMMADLINQFEELDDAEDDNPFLSSYFDEIEKNRIAPIVKPILDNNSAYFPPKFNHPEINVLYEYELNLPHDLINKILNLPRATLIQDLETILNDAVINFHYYKKRDLDFNENAFLLNAMIFLKELRSVESLPKILAVLENDENFLDFYLDSFITDILWQVIYVLGINQTDLILEFLLKPGIDTQAKINVLSAFEQIIYNNDDKKDEIIAHYKTITNKFSNATLQDNLIDSDFLEFVANDIATFKIDSLVPIIKDLYEKKWINKVLLSGYDEFIEAYEEIYNNNFKIQLDSIYNIYSLENDDSDDDNDFSFNEMIEELSKPIQPFLQSSKINRNDNCPCGSGKKYKKCCINK